MGSTLRVTLRVSAASGRRSRSSATGVGELIRIGVEKGRSTNAKLSCGICGEHGADPDSIRFFEEVGLDYVSCSPYRVPVARIAAAQAAITAR